MTYTVPHYYEQPYTKTLRATVVAVDTYKGKPAVILDTTICYPEGGGQPGDQGFLDANAIVDTVKDEQGHIYHLLNDNPSYVAGDVVTVSLDWEHRYDYMQQHTAQHLLSGALFRLFGISTVSVHLGHDELSIEVDTQEMTDTMIDELEDEVNGAIRSNVPVLASIVTQEKAQQLGLRRTIKVSGDVRIIQIGAYDTIACGGIHVGNTGELELIQAVRQETIRGHVRTFWIAGRRAVHTVRKNRTMIKELGALLSAPPSEIVEAVSQVQTQLADARYQQGELAEQLAHLRLAAAVHSSERYTDVPLVFLDASDWSELEYAQLPQALFAYEHILLCAVRTRSDGRLNWMIAQKGISDDPKWFQMIRREALGLIDGKGGGKPPLWQGIGENAAQKEVFMKKIEDLVLGSNHGRSR
jgi:alanyl-tRNA synthetase